MYMGSREQPETTEPGDGRKETKMEATYSDSTGKMSVTFRGETRIFDALPNSDGGTAVCVFGVKYPTGTKVWPASVTVYQGKTSVTAGGYGRGGNQSGAVNLLGWYKDLV